MVTPRPKSRLRPTGIEEKCFYSGRWALPKSQICIKIKWIYKNKMRPDRHHSLQSKKGILTIIPGDDAWIISGLKFFTSLYMRGLNARDIGTALYQGNGKLPIRNTKTSKHYYEITRSCQRLLMEPSWQHSASRTRVHTTTLVCQLKKIVYLQEPITFAPWNSSGTPWWVVTTRTCQIKNKN